MHISAYIKKNIYKTIFTAGIVLLLLPMVFAAGRFAYIDHLSKNSFSAKTGETSKIYIYAVEPVNIQIKIYDSKDRLIREFPVQKKLLQGYHHYTWNGKTADGKILPAGVYKYEVTFWSTKGDYAYSEEDFISIAEDTISAIPPMPKKIIKGAYKPLPFETEFRGISDTRVESGDDSTRDDDIYERFKMDFRGKYKQNILSDLSLEYQSSPISGAKELDLRSAGAGYAYKRLKTDFFYKKYVGFYDTPLRLFASYKANRDRSGARVRGNFADTSFEVMYHKLNAIDEAGAMLRLEQGLGKGIYLGVSSVNRLFGNSNNYIMGVDASLEYRSLMLKGEFAYAKETDLDVADNAWRGEISIPYRSLKFGAAYQNIGKDFIGYYSDVPHSQDSMGYEVNVSFRPAIKNNNYIRSTNITVAFDNFDNHFKNDLKKTINTKLHMSFKKDISTLVSYSVTDSVTNDSASGFINIGYGRRERFNTRLRVTILDSDEYKNTSVKGAGEYLFVPGLKGKGELEYSKRELSVLGIEQDYDVMSMMAGISKELLQALELYGQVRVSRQESKSLNSIYLNLRYKVVSDITALISYGSFSSLEQQERLFGQMRVKF